MSNDLMKHLKPDTAMMLETLSRQVGRDAVEVACEMACELGYADFASTSPEWKATVFQGIHDIMRVKGDPFTPENARHAAQFFLSNLECDIAAAHEANPPTPPPFKPKSKEAEQDFFQTASADQLKEYFLAKHGAR